MKAEKLKDQSKFAVFTIQMSKWWYKFDQNKLSRQPEANLIAAKEVRKWEGFKVDP